MRIIDADALIDTLGVSDEDINFREMLDSAPSIDIVRCKECKYNYNKVLNHGKMEPRCDFTDRVLTENDFCSRGEREGE